MSREQWAAGRPALTAFNRQVLKAWHWCGGWQPERIAAAAAHLDIADVDLLTDLLLLVRDAVEAHQRRQREARGR